MELYPIKLGTMSDSCSITHSKEGERPLAAQGSPGLARTPNQTLTLQQSGAGALFTMTLALYSHFYNGVKSPFNDFPLLPITDNTYFF